MQKKLRIAMNKVMLIYTGGTIGMGQNPQTGALEPLDFNHLVESMPEFQLIKADIDVFKETEIAQSRDRVSKICRVKQIAVFQGIQTIDTFRFHPVECRQVTVQHDLFIPDDKYLPGNRHVLDSGF